MTPTASILRNMDREAFRQLARTYRFLYGGFEDRWEKNAGDVMLWHNLGRRNDARE